MKPQSRQPFLRVSIPCKRVGRSLLECICVSQGLEADADLGRESNVTFLYTLVPGTSASFGLNVARLARLPRELLAVAVTKARDIEVALSTPLKAPSGAVSVDTEMDGHDLGNGMTDRRRQARRVLQAAGAGQAAALRGLHEDAMYT